MLFRSYVAEKDGEIISYVNGGNVNFIDSICADSSLAGLVLFSRLEGALEANGLPTNFAGTINDEAGDLLLKLGYTEITKTRFFYKKRS